MVKIVDLGLEILAGDLDKGTQFISLLLSYAIVTGSFILKIPQILKIMRSQSVQGISLAMLVMELIGYAISSLYSYQQRYELATYAESPVILLQNVALIALYVSLSKVDTMKLVAGTVLFGLWIYLSMVDILPPSFSTFLMTFVNIPLFAASRIPQIYNNHKNKSTGMLEPTGFVLALGGCAARIFTTLADTADPVILLGFVINFVLNGAIIAQIFLYWGAKADKKE